MKNTDRGIFRISLIKCSAWKTYLICRWNSCSKSKGWKEFITRNVITMIYIQLQNLFPYIKTWFNQLCCMHLIAELTCNDNHNLLIDVFHFRVWVERRTEKTRLKCLLPDYTYMYLLRAKASPQTWTFQPVVLHTGTIGGRHWDFWFCSFGVHCSSQIVCFKTFGFWYSLKSTPGFLDLVSNRVFWFFLFRSQLHHHYDVE